MSVTLKLADEDAAVVGSILKAFAEAKKPGPPDGTDIEAYKHFWNRMRASCGSRSMEHINDIAGAFQIAVRANQR